MAKSFGKVCTGSDLEAMNCQISSPAPSVARPPARHAAVPQAIEFKEISWNHAWTPLDRPRFPFPPAGPGLEASFGPANGHFFEEMVISSRNMVIFGYIWPYLAIFGFTNGYFFEEMAIWAGNMAIYGYVWLYMEKVRGRGPGGGEKSPTG